MRIRGIIICIILIMVSGQAQVPARIKWACIGSGATAGYPTASLSYAPRLATLLGPQDTIQNDGVSNTTILKKGDKPYWTQGKLGTVFAFKPDIILVELGTDDTKAQNWLYNSDFVSDFSALVDTLAGNISPSPLIYLFLPPPIFTNTLGYSDSILTNSVIPLIHQVAAAKSCSVIDANTPLRNRSTLFSDGVHPTAAGSDSISAITYRTYLAGVMRIACIGNSITQYVGTVTGAVGVDAYPSKLNMLLGRGYFVQNEGVSGTYMQKQGRTPYWTNGKLPAVFTLKPNIITIMLGTNDSRATQWNTARYITDYKAMIDTLSINISSKPQIWLCCPMPAWKDTGVWGYDNGIPGNGINGNTIRDSVIPAIHSVATAKGLPTIDLYTPMLPCSSYCADGVHPNAAGQDTLAHVIYRSLKSGTVGVLSTRPQTFQKNKRGTTTVMQLQPLPFKQAGGSSYFSLDGKAVVLYGKTVSPGVLVRKNPLQPADDK